jgi:HEAT repeat protein
LYHAIILKKTHGTLIAPLALKYYQQATLENEKRYLLSWIPKQAASNAIPILLQDFYSDKGNVDRWAIADTLYGFASKKYWQEYLDIISQSEYGIDRQMLILLVGKLKIEEAIPALITLLDDECVTLHALCALSRYKKPELRGCFERFVNSPNTTWRKQAMKALQQLSKR